MLAHVRARVCTCMCACVHRLVLARGSLDEWIAKAEAADAKETKKRGKGGASSSPMAASGHGGEDGEDDLDDNYTLDGGDDISESNHGEPVVVEVNLYRFPQAA